MPNYAHSIVISRKLHGEAMEATNFENIISSYIPMPVCMINANGKITSANDKIGEVFIYDAITDADIFALTNIKHKDFIAAAEGTKNLTLSRNDKIFKIHVHQIEDSDNHLAVYFVDVTNHEKLKRLYNDERVCMALVQIDNYDELSKSTSEEKSVQLLGTIDKSIRQWGARLNASVTRFKKDLYLFVMESLYCDKLIENKFAILDDIREIETEGDFPVTLSIGIGINGKSFAHTDQYARDALDLALGRGGDQAVIKNISNIQYFGGKSQSVEKGNKGKSRIVAHAFKQLIDQASRVIIMGHFNPDMDAFGAAIGISRMVKSGGKDAYIVVNNVTEALSEVYRQAKETEQYNLINSEKALAIINDETLLVIVDTHKPELTDCPELIEKTERIAVIDHHRKMESVIENPTLSYMESYASSTCELVTEMLQYSDERKNVTKFEAEALLAGITVDTNNFAVKTGVRTFEAASWLRRTGANTTAVKRFFQTDVNSFIVRSRCVANAEIIEEHGLAFSILDGTSPESQILCAQVADELLKVKGIKASFVAGVNAIGQTVVSARSLGEMNVQVIMEKFGGGGHLTTAGAQINTPPPQFIQELKTLLIGEDEE